jgi:hypothetical protein
VILIVRTFVVLVLNHVISFLYSLYVILTAAHTMLLLNPQQNINFATVQLRPTTCKCQGNPVLEVNYQHVLALISCVQLSSPRQGVRRIRVGLN